MKTMSKMPKAKGGQPSKKNPPPEAAGTIARKPKRKHDDRLVIEYVIEVLNDVRKRLRVGAQGPGAMLTADECVKVLACLKNPPNPAHAPKQDISIEQFRISTFCFALEDAGVSVENAVAATVKHFGCSRSTVFAARKAYTPPKIY
jgi:hypothetical protein